MKKYLPLIAIIIIFAGTLIIATRAINRENCREYSRELQEQGYSATWAIHKAHVEYGYSEPDELYWAIEED